jgi:two-component system, LuxR family, sensor kinase FixL
MPWVEQLADPQELRRCIRDLVALSTLPAIWKSYGPHQIADSVTAALVSMLGADFVHITLPGRPDEPRIEVTHVGRKIPPESVDAIHTALRQASLERTEQTAVIADPLGNGQLRVATAPIGFRGDAILIAGSFQANFPTEGQRLLLGIGANDATIALQRWQAEGDERRFVSMVERTADFIGFSSLDGRPQYINPSGLELLGLGTMEEASRAHVLELVAPDDRDRARDECWPVVMRSGRWVGELNFRHFRTGEIIPFLVDWFRIDDPRTGRPMNLATVSRDLRVQKRSEAELRNLNDMLERRVSDRTAELAETSNKLVSETRERKGANARLQVMQLELFHAARLSAAATLAHELNQPLTATTNSVNAARRLLKKKGREKIGTVREIMDEAAEQTLRAGQIVRRLRDFVTRGETEMQSEDVRTMIEEASGFALTGLGAAGVEMHLSFDPKAPKAFANRIQVQQILVNLIRNALEAMAKSKRRELQVTTALLDEETVEIAVADTGPGIAKDVADHLFEPFVSTKREGMGLGLSICRSIVEAHGGKLRSEPKPGGGTIFRFTLAATMNGRNNAG